MLRDSTPGRDLQFLRSAVGMARGAVREESGLIRKEAAVPGMIELLDDAMSDLVTNRTLGNEWPMSAPGPRTKTTNKISERLGIPFADFLRAG